MFYLSCSIPNEVTKKTFNRFHGPYPTYLPLVEAGGTQEVAAGLNLDVLVVLRTDLTQLERGAHLTVQLILLLGHLGVDITCKSQ